MYARVTTFQAPPNRANDINDVAFMIRHSVLPGFTAVPGFRGGLLLTDAARNRCMTITLWATEADMAASEESGVVQALRSGLLDSVPVAVSVERYEVVATDLLG